MRSPFAPLVAGAPRPVGLRENRGFTLIELLVVISIIAVLIGILLPALSSARATARQIKCAAQLKQLDAAMDMFATDHRSFYPIAGGTIDWDEIDNPPNPDLKTERGPWMRQISYYFKSGEEDFAACPDYPRETPYTYFLGARIAYKKKGVPFPVRRNLIRYSSSFVLGGDNNHAFKDTAHDADKDDYSQDTLNFDVPRGTTAPPIGELTPKSWYPQHRGGLNVMFPDGHVALFKKFDDQLMTYGYDKLGRTWDDPEGTKTTGNGT